MITLQRIVVVILLTTVVPTLIAFSVSIDHGFKVLEWTYPHEQLQAPFRNNPLPVYAHLYLNSLAILVGPLQFNETFRKNNPQIHRMLGFIYLVALSLGSVGAILYATSRSYGDDFGFAAQVSFSFMALAAIIPSYTSFYHIAVNGDYLTHQCWMLRSYSCLFGDWFVFRLLTWIYLPYAPKLYPGWIAMIWGSWFIPLMFMEQYITYLQRTRIEALWNHLSNGKDIKELYIMLSSRQQERLNKKMK